MFIRVSSGLEELKNLTRKGTKVPYIDIIMTKVSNLLDSVICTSLIRIILNNA